MHRLLVVLVFAASTLIFNLRTVRHLNEQRPCHPEVMQQHLLALHGNDTGEFLRLLDKSANALKHGHVYFPISDYDCPVTFLLPAGFVRLMTPLEPIVILNLFFLSVFLLSGSAAYWFFRTIGGPKYVAVIFGVFYQSANFAFFAHHMGHMNNAQVQWIPLVFVATAHLLSAGARARWVVLLGLSMGLQVLSSPSYAVYLFFVALPIFVITYLVCRRKTLSQRYCKRLALQFSLSVVLALAISSFYLISRIGSMPHVYPPPTWLPFAFYDVRQFLDPTQPFLFIGFPLCVLLILSIHWWASYNRGPMTTAIVFTLAGALVMMLPAVPGTPYWALYKVNPLFHHLRVPTRFFPIFLLMLLGLCVLYLKDNAQSHSRVRLRWIASALLLLQMVFYWFSSPWILHVDTVAIARQLLGKAHLPASMGSPTNSTALPHDQIADR